MFWKNRQHLSELLTAAKGKSFVAMVMKDRYWHKSPEGNDKCIFKIYKQNSPKKSKY